jgi:NAD(P)-dependent dehydrogenase (short-subunit alcohol dehydrogenase family)
LAAQGAAIAFLGACPENEDAAAMIRSEGCQAVVAGFDASSVAGVASGFESIEQELGRAIGMLINNTGEAFTAKSFSGLAWAETQALLEAELCGVYHYCQGALKPMMERKSGVIVNLGSTLTRQTPLPMSVPYVMAKSALLGLTRALAAEAGPHGIRVNMVSLGPGDLGPAEGTSDRLRKVQAMQTPLRRLVTPEDIAKTVAFLCSDASGFLTGVDLPLSGGVHI